MSKRRQSGGLSTMLSVLIAVGAIGGLHGVAEIISAIGDLIEGTSKRCSHADADATPHGGAVDVSSRQQVIKQIDLADEASDE